jgi:hypothetical protein
MSGILTRYVITPGSLSALPNTPTAVYTVSLTDDGGDPVAAPQLLIFSLDDGGAGGTFTPSAVTIPTGGMSGSFTYSNAAACHPTLTVLPVGGPLAGLPQAQQLPGSVGITTQACISVYAQWPTIDDVQDFLLRADITLRGEPAQSVLDAVIYDVQRRTLRQFVADTHDTQRTYAGTGTAEQEIDEIIALTSVTVVGYQSAPGYTLGSVQVFQEQGKPQTRLITARGSLPGLVGEGYIAPYPTRFPTGRSNILVTGVFGYSCSIPPDLWNAVAGEMAFRLASEAMFSPQGRVLEDDRGDVRKKYREADPALIGWHADYMNKTAACIGGYARPSGRRLRNLFPRPFAEM